MKKLKLIIFFLSLSTLVMAQKQDADQLLKQAITQTNIDKDYPKAIQTVLKALKLSPNYVDLRLLLGRLYLLTGKYQAARTELKWVLDKQPKNLDALTYLINVETEIKNYDQALLYADRYLSYSSTSEMQQKKEGISNAKKDEIAESHKNRIGISYDYTFFDPSTYQSWNFISMNYTRELAVGTFGARINYVDRGTDAGNGYQFELEAYPKHKSGYSFINSAYSNSTVFSKLRLGYSYFHNLKNGWEGEIGARYVNAANTHLKTLTASVGKYWGNNWVNLRPFVTNEISRYYLGTVLTARQYFQNKDSYATMILGYGNSPDDRTRDFQFGTRYNLTSYSVSLGFQHLIARSNIIGILGTYNNQELSNTKKRNEFDLFLNFQRKF